MTQHRRPHRSPRKKRSLRVLVQLLLGGWAWAVLLLPLLHNIHHHADHVHGPFGVTFLPALRQHLGAEHDHYGLGDQGLHSGQHAHRDGAGNVHWHSHAAAPQSKKDAEKPTQEHRAPQRKRPSKHGDGSPEHLQVWFLTPTFDVSAPWATFRYTLPREPQPATLPPEACEPWLRRGRAPPGCAVSALS